MTAITSADITAALAQDPRFADPDDVIFFVPHLERLPEILGAERMAQPVTLAALLQAEVVFIRWILGQDLSAGFESIRVQLSRLVAALEHIDVEITLASTGMTEADVMLSPEFGLTPAARPLYLAGQLTFAELVRTSPGALIPRAA